MNTIVKSAAIAAALPTVAPVIAAAAAEPAPNPDAALIALCDDFIIAFRNSCKLGRKVDHMDEFKPQPFPDALRWRETDAALGLEPYSFPKDREPRWDRPVDVDPLRKKKWLSGSKEIDEEGDIEFITVNTVVPSAEARARADEIIAAYDKWRGDRRPVRGYKKAEREYQKALRAAWRIEQRIAAIRATTFEGMQAKIRCAQTEAEAEKIDQFDSGSTAHTMAGSIFLDLQQMKAA